MYPLAIHLWHPAKMPIMSFVPNPFKFFLQCFPVLNLFWICLIWFVLCYFGIVKEKKSSMNRILFISWFINGPKTINFIKITLAMYVAHVFFNLCWIINEMECRSKKKWIIIMKKWKWNLFEELCLKLREVYGRIKSIFKWCWKTET